MSVRATAAEQDGAAADRLVAESRALMATVSEKIMAASLADGDHHGMSLFAEGLPLITERLGVLERATRSVVYNLQRRCVFDPRRRERELNQHTRARGIQGHMITPTAPHISLIAASHPDTWVAPVEVCAIAIDERLAMFSGPLSPRGLPTAWLCRDQDVVMRLCDLWAKTKQHAVPIRDVPGVVRLSDRQLDVAALLCRGAKDTTIARVLGVSPRTVTGDVGRLLDALGVSTRWEAGMMIGRVSPPSLRE